MTAFQHDKKSSSLGALFPPRRSYLGAMKAPFFLVLVLLAFPALSQQQISGHVVNEGDGSPIAGCSVFIAGSSRGTVTNASGYFVLDNVPTGRHDLVVSSIGYTTFSYSITETMLPLRLLVKMEVKAKELPNVVVEPSVLEGWDKWGKAFMDNFIGTADNAAFCKITNTGTLSFRYFKKSNRLVAYADEPVEIVNKALGYTIKYQLENFEVNFSTRTVFFSGYPLFVDDTREGKQPRKKWVSNRSKAYHGSITHFLVSLYNNNLTAEGFEVRRMTRKPNLEKERVRQAYRNRMVRTTNSEGKTIVRSEPLPADSQQYYERVMRQPDLIDSIGSSMLTADSVLLPADGGAVRSLLFDNYLYIVYKKELESPMYLQAQMENRKPSFQRSILTLVTYEPIVFDAQGNYFDPQNLLSSWYWGWSQKVADMLPSDYEP